MKNRSSLLTKVAICWLGTVSLANAGLINPGFETGDFTGWTGFGDTGFTIISSADCGHSFPTSCTPHTGSFAAFFGNPSLGGVTQSVATVPGASYVFDFWLKVDVASVGYVGTEYIISWDSTVLADVVDAPISSWQHLSYTTTAISSSSVVKFEFLNHPDWFGLDDVSVTAVGEVPEPVSSILAGASLLALAGLGRVLRRRP